MSTEIVTGHQARVVMLFNQYKETLLPSRAVTSTYRCEGYNVSVKLAYKEGSQNYIVRETIKWYASQQSIYFAVSRLIEHLGKTYARSTTGSEKNLFLKL